MLHKRLARLEANAPKQPEKVLVVGSQEDLPQDFDGTIIVTGVPRPQDKVQR